jgi:hypothetical protein
LPLPLGVRARRQIHRPYAPYVGHARLDLTVPRLEFHMIGFHDGVSTTLLILPIVLVVLPGMVLHLFDFICALVLTLHLLAGLLVMLWLMFFVCGGLAVSVAVACGLIVSRG